jgi:glyoxylase-like metal-dependent hydrolase (beta-lactamase superfamily II)
MIKEIFPSLFWIRAQTLASGTPFTYFLRRPAGNILFGTKEDISSLAGELKSMGGIESVLLGDRHHALPHSAAFAQRMGTVLTASDIEAKALKSGGVKVGQILPLVRTPLADDLEIIPTPGHTRGALSYLWTNRKKRFLFIGDTLVPESGTWEFYVTRPNRAEMTRTIKLLMTVEFDVILSNSFAAIPEAWLEVTPKRRSRILSDVLEALSR